MEPEPHRLGSLRALLLAVAALLALLPSIFTLPPTDVDESRFVQATKQMLETGDVVDIRFQDQPRYKKPPGVYWLQVATVKLTGHGAEAPLWAYRLASTFSAVASVVVAAALGAYLFGRTAGVIAGILLIAITDFAFEARIAKSDSALLLACLSAQYALARLYVGARRGEPPSGWTALLFWTAQAAGILIKGPVTPLLSALTVAALALADRERAWLKRLRPVAGLAVLLALAAPWFVAITLKSGGAFWSESVGKDLVGKIVQGQESHGFPPGFFFVTSALFFWPAVPLAVDAVLRTLSRWREPAFLFLLAWAAPFWMLLELVPTKLPNYVLPAYPALAILAAWAILPGASEPAKAGWAVWLRRIALLGAIVTTTLLAIAAIAAMPVVTGRFSFAGIVAAILIVAAGWLGTGLRTPENAMLRMGGMAAAAAAAMGVLATFVAPALNPLWPSPRIADALAAAKLCETPRLAAVGYRMPSLVFLTRTDTLLTDAAGAARHLAGDPGCAAAVAPPERMTEIAKAIGGPAKIAELARIDLFALPGEERRELVLFTLAR